MGPDREVQPHRPVSLQPVHDDLTHHVHDCTHARTLSPRTIIYAELFQFCSSRDTSCGVTGVRAGWRTVARTCGRRPRPAPPRRAAQAVSPQRAPRRQDRTESLGPTPHVAGPHPTNSKTNAVANAAPTWATSILESVMPGSTGSTLVTNSPRPPRQPDETLTSPPDLARLAAAQPVTVHPAVCATAAGSTSQLTTGNSWRSSSLATGRREDLGA